MATMTIATYELAQLEAMSDAELAAHAEEVRLNRRAVKQYQEDIAELQNLRVTKHNLLVKLARMSDAELVVLGLDAAKIAEVQKVREGLSPATGPARAVGLNGVEGKEAVGRPGGQS